MNQTFVLDLPTIIVVNTLICFIVSLMLVVNRLTLRQVTAGPISWATADLCLYLANLALLHEQRSPLLAGLRLSFVDGVPAGVIPGAFVASAFWWRRRALLRVEGQRLNWYRAPLESCCISIAWMALSWGVIDDGAIRLRALGAVVGVGSVLLMLPLVRLSRRYWGARVMLTITCVTFVMMILRVAAVGPFANPNVSDALVRGLLTQIVVSLLLTLGFMTLLQEQVRQQLAELSTSDALTGLLNRRGLMTLLERDIERAHRAKRPLSLVIFDIDHFKKVNDRYGHATGDEVLRGFASRLTKYSRRGDITARWGGEEFVMVLPDTDVAQAVRVAERVRKETRASPLCDRAEISVTVSGGVAECVLSLNTAEDIEQLMRTADERLYSAKMTRDQICAGLREGDNASLERHVGAATSGGGELVS